jgi:hypothetical protein
MPQNNKYPVTLDIDYSDKSDRLTAFFRLISCHTNLNNSWIIT